MKALVYRGEGVKEWAEVPDPVVEAPEDVVVRVGATTICGTDLHILKGDVPAVAPGRILGHEAVGTVVAAGPGVAKHKVGDRVLVGCVSICGECAYCSKGMPSHCLHGGSWILGHLIDGTQAELVRVPYADTSCYVIPDGASDEAALMLSDILPTGYEIGVLNGHVKHDDVVAVIGAGPVGLAAMLTMAPLGPAHVIAIDLDDNRLEVAKQFGATHTFRADDPDLVEKVRGITPNGLGVDVAVEAVGTPATWATAISLIDPGGHVAVVGVHGMPVEFHLETEWIRNITVTTGLVNTTSIPTLLGEVASGAIDSEKFITHRFKLDDIDSAYEVFGNAATNKALKVALTR